MITSVKVRAPSSTANLGPGFDVFGLALDAFYDEIILSKTNKSITTNKPWHGIRILTTDDVPKESTTKHCWVSNQGNETKI